jgi:large subunit ribosomal protein L24
MELSLDKHVNRTKIRKGDEVIVTTGRSRGHKGKVERVDTKTYRVYVTGANLFKKHQKPDAQNPDGGIIEKSVGIHLSNVMLVDPKTDKATRIGFKLDANGIKTRFAKSSGTSL